ncbi:lytic transglycosylase domain-containing protein [Proteinivorax hydrogeniformans]|uniref:Lytic transglycosylase domain-containing protein n=1 Tax=Proteinivorax hydrogeniformans TaxID=1826727 RepID=A0AAU8HRY8_9FIRM
MKKNLIVYVAIILILFTLVFALHQTNIIWRYLYPTDYKDLVYEYSYKNDLDPYLVFSIIKVESKFQEDAVSRRGALGLMQLMPDTAKWIAEQKGVNLKSEDEILKPEVNIALGTWYLKHLIDNYDDKNVAIASYNAGRGNVKKWLDEGVWDGSLKLANEIPFAETREYVYKVNIAYQKYKEIY